VPPRNTILQLSTPCIDPILSNSLPAKFQNFTCYILFFDHVTTFLLILLEKIVPGCDMMAGIQLAISQ